MPGCLSSVSQEAINNSRLRSLVLHRKAENESHLEVCSALSMPFGQQHTKAHRPETSTFYARAQEKGKKAASLLSRAEKETSQLPSLSFFVPMSVDATVLFSGKSAARAFSEQLLQKPVVITSVIFFPASKLASCPSAIWKLRSAAPPPHAACSICSAAATWPSLGVLEAQLIVTQQTSLLRATGTASRSGSRRAQAATPLPGS